MDTNNLSHIQSALYWLCHGQTECFFVQTQNVAGKVTWMRQIFSHCWPDRASKISIHSSSRISTTINTEINHPAALFTLVFFRTTYALPASLGLDPDGRAPEHATRSNQSTVLLSPAKITAAAFICFTLIDYSSICSAFASELFVKCSGYIAHNLSVSVGTYFSLSALKAAFSHRIIICWCSTVDINIASRGALSVASVNFRFPSISILFSSVNFLHHFFKKYRRISSFQAVGCAHMEFLGSNEAVSKVDTRRWILSFCSQFCRNRVIQRNWLALKREHGHSNLEWVRAKCPMAYIGFHLKRF